MAAMVSGLTLRSIREFDYDISFFCSDLESSPVKPPLGMVLIMENSAETRQREMAAS